MLWTRRCIDVAVGVTAVLLACAIAEGQTLPERTREFVRRRHEERGPRVPSLPIGPTTHGYYGPSFSWNPAMYAMDASVGDDDDGTSTKSNGTDDSRPSPVLPPASDGRPSKSSPSSLKGDHTRAPHSSGSRYGTRHGSASFKPSFSSSSSSSSRREDSGPARPAGRPLSAVAAGSAAGTGAGVFEQQRKRLLNARNVINAGNKFGLNLMKFLIKENQNTIMAPLSLSIALSMLYFASAGNTMKELSRALHYDEFGLNADTLVEPLRGIATAGKVASGSDRGFSLELGNFLFAQKGLNVSQKYRDIIKDVFASSVDAVDFSRPDEALKYMNERVTQATRGHIAQPLESISPQVRMVLMNAVYFKGFWKQPFSVRSSFDSVFANDGVQEVPVKMMYMRSHFLVKSLDDIAADAIQLPYEGDATFMLILLPHHPQGVHSMLQKLNVGKLAAALPTFENQSLDLHIPRFSVRGSYQFKQHLSELGVHDLFTPDAASLPEIDPEGRVSLDNILHEAKIEVDERGTEGAAVTAATIINYSRYPSFNIRHPFVFFIVHRPTGAVFFAGKILRMNDDTKLGGDDS